MKILINIVSLAIVLIIVSCDNVNTSENIKKIDTLKVMVDKIDKLKTQIDEVKTTEIYDNIKQDLDFFVKNMKELPQNTKHLEYFKKYTELRRICKTYFQHNDYIQQAEYSKSQLSALEKDMAHNAITNEKFQKYYNDEYNADKSLLIGMEKHIEAQQEIFDKYNKYIPVINEMKDSLKTLDIKN